MRLKVSRQALGATNGNTPSKISINPSANNNVVLMKTTAQSQRYFALRMYLKNSELGSKTMTSDLLLKLFL
jgi:hypothetical protein